MATIKKASAMSCAIYIAATRDTYSSANSWRVDLRFEMTEANRSAMKAGLDIPSTEAWPSKLGRIRLRDLGARIYVGSDWAMACGESLRYSEVYGIELRDAEIMAHTLKSIERALHKVREKYGSPADVGAWLRRLCEVTGVTEVHFSSEACALMVTLASLTAPMTLPRPTTSSAVSARSIAGKNRSPPSSKPSRLSPAVFGQRATGV